MIKCDSNNGTSSKKTVCEVDLIKVSTANIVSKVYKIISTIIYQLYSLSCIKVLQIVVEFIEGRR